MKRTLLLLTGTLSLLLASQTTFGASSSSSSSSLSLSSSSSSTPSTLYERIRQGTEQELFADTVEQEIIDYVRAVLATLEETISDADVTAAVQQNDAELCGKRREGTSGRTRMGCDELGQRIRNLVASEERIRSLGRSLQLAATSYELPTSHIPGRGVRFAADIRGIVNIWSPEMADTGSAVHSASGSTAGRTRTKAVDEATMRPLLEALGNALRVQPKEQQTAAVWRYQYGVRLVLGERDPDFPPPFEDSESGPGTERQHLFTHWFAVEDALIDIWEAVKGDPVAPPLQPGETVLYSFPEDLLKETLPDNVLVWLRTDDPAGPHILGDSGLGWIVPLEPVLPSLLDDAGTPIPGGTYPPEPMDGPDPVDGRGLCSDPESARGYLCRPFTPASGEACPEDRAYPIDPAKIHLVTCLDDSKNRTTLSGPDVCRDTDIREDVTFDPQRECRISFRCGNDCGAELGGGVDAVAKSKDSTGNIEICVDQTMSGPGLTELVFHELVHAYQFCTMPPGYDYNSGKTDEQKAALCCEMEGGGYAAQCNMAAENGAFDGNPVFPGTDIPLNAETCAETLANLACGPSGYQRTASKCYESRIYPPGFTAAIFAKITGNPKVDNDPVITCNTLSSRDTMDPRIRDLVDAIEGRRDVCAPGQREVFRNSIGNNMCYIGQCVEETLELYRTTGGQTPSTVGDETAPFHDAKTGAPLGNAVINPPLNPGQLASYRPQLVVQELESKICQLQGLPPLTPSILCTYNPARNIVVPVIDYTRQAQSFLQGGQSEADSTSQTLSLALGLGSRLGTAMYAEELRLASRSLADVLTAAVSLFKEMGAIQFPTEMCPTDNTLAVPPPPAL